jgi:hypothetical protein
MLFVRVKEGKIFVEKGGLVCSGDPIEAVCDGYVVKFETCPACPEENFCFRLDVYYDRNYNVPYIAIDEHFRIPLYRPFRFKNIYIEVVENS